MTTQTTIEELRRDPTEYLGQNVSVTGYATIEFESINLWASRTAARSYDCKNATGLYFEGDGWKREQVESYSRRYVTVYGVFSELICGDTEEDEICVSTGHCGADGIIVKSIQERVR